MIEYRKAALVESALLAKIRIDFLCEANDVSSEDEKNRLFDSNRQFISNSLADGSFISWVAVESGKIIATSGITFYTLPPNKKCPNGKVAYISNMFTYSHYRGQGIATKLFALSVEEATNAGCIKILLNATDMGKPIYEKFGFKDTKNDMAYYAL